MIMIPALRFINSLFLICITTVALGQSDTVHFLRDQRDSLLLKGDSIVSKKDTVDFIQNMQQLGRNATLRNREIYIREKISYYQHLLIEDVVKAIERAKAYQHKGIDTLSIIDQLLANQRAIDLAKDGILINRGTIQTNLNLTVSESILNELLVNSLQTRNTISKYTMDAFTLRNNIDSLLSDSTLYQLPHDSAAIVNYVTKHQGIARQMVPLDSFLSGIIHHIQDLQNRANNQVYDIRSTLEEIDKYHDLIAEARFSREVPNIWKPVTYARPLQEIIDFSVAKNWMALRFYIRNNLTGIILMAAAIILCATFLKLLRRRIILHSQDDTDQPDKYLGIKYPMLTATVIIISPMQFIFLDTPFLFNAALWLITAVCLTIIFHNYITRYWMRFWIIILILFVIACLNNLILQASRVERWLMILLAVTGILFSLLILTRGRRNELKEKRIIFFIAMIIVFEVLSIAMNIFGRYNVSKTLFTSGYISVVIAINFLWCVRLLNGVLNLAYDVYKQPQAESFYINFKRVGRKSPFYFYALMIVGWLILVGRNFYAFETFSRPFIEFLNKQRSIGSYSFSIEGVFVFLLIMICSLLLSKFISFFVSEPKATGAHQGESPKEVEVGSWILLVRIFIISIGVFLAFAAAGIPLSQITIIIGALGVGIGLGLQGLVSSLVSGLIIAFEKPVNVGDLIELNGSMGTVKSIGFRSSIVTLVNGASIVIPNGDLLNDRLTNWTMGRNLKRISIPVGVAYGTDLKKAIEILIDTVSNDNRIRSYPAPSALARQFGAGSIDLELFFWVDIRDDFATKSEVLTRIHTAFKEAGIEIPFPQQDIYLRELPNAQKGSE
jgi:potassium efflux system protein